MKHLLLYDSNLDGHHADYLIHLIHNWGRQTGSNRLTVATPAELPALYEKTCQEKWPASVYFQALDERRIETLRQLSYWQRARQEWQYVKNVAKEVAATDVLLMYADVFIPALALETSRNAPGVSGIYFRPSFHYPATGLKAKAVRLAKKWLVQAALRSPSLKNFFCLDSSAVAYAKAQGFGQKLVPLCDPIRVYERQLDQKAFINRHQLEPDKPIYLLFGHLDDRKGIYQLVDALKLLPPAEAAAANFLLAGYVNEDYREGILTKLAEVPPYVPLRTHFEEIKGQAIQDFFDASDYILALYQNHVGMSSVVVRAGVSGKPLLASDYGFMGKLVDTRRLGQVVDSTSPPAIAGALSKIIREGISYDAGELTRIAAENSPQQFAGTLLHGFT